MDIKIDLHNHSCLSPCGDLSMSPLKMAQRAVETSLGLMALTDHSAALNCPAFAITAARHGLIPLFGLELNSREEVHLLAIFPTPQRALAFGTLIAALIPELPWDPGIFGDQVIVDENEFVIALKEDVWLAGALVEGFEDLAVLANRMGALVIPAHVDRSMYSVHSQLGFLPPGPYDAVESIRVPEKQLKGDHCVVSGSDAHYPEQIGKRPTVVNLPDDLVLDMRSALKDYAHACSERNESGGNKNGEDPRLALYPDALAERLFESLRKELREKRVKPNHAANR
jgi:hypothetical protein